MKQQISILVTCTIIALLTACSGGGDSDSINNTPDDGTSFTVGSYKSNVSGGDTGTLYFTVDGDLNASGAVVPTSADSFSVSGSINPQGDFQLSSSIGFEFMGTIDSNGVVAGNWSDSLTDLNGSITGDKLPGDVIALELSNAGYSRGKSCRRLDDNGDTILCRENETAGADVYCPLEAGYETSNLACPSDQRIGQCPAGSYGVNKSLTYNDNYYIQSEFVKITINSEPFRFYDIEKETCPTAFQEFNITAVVRAESCRQVDDVNGLIFCRDKANAGGNVTFDETATVDCPAGGSAVASSRACPLSNRIAVCPAGTFIDGGIIKVILSNDNWYAGSKDTFLNTTSGSFSFFDLTIGDCHSTVLVDLTIPPIISTPVPSSSFGRSCCDSMSSVYSVAAGAGIILPPTSLGGGFIN